MNTFQFTNQSVQIAKDEWRLQWRSWGTWLLGLFLLSVVISEHPAFSVFGEFSLPEAAGFWADRVTIVGSLVAILTVPFALDRVRRQRMTPIEFTKPFDRLAYVLGKFAGATLPLFTLTAVSLFIHLVITFFTKRPPLAGSVVTYLGQAILVNFVPLLFFTSLTYCMSVFIRRPIIIIPIGLSYMILTMATQASADAQFSWFSAVVRPEYFGGIIPESLMSTVLTHHVIYLGLSVLLLTLTVIGFRHSRFTNDRLIAEWWKRIRLPSFPFIDMRFRMLWNGYIVAALLMALVAIANTMSNPNEFLRVEYAFFGLEFYLSLSGLLLLSGVLVRDKAAGALNLVLTKPVNRWRLLAERLLPAMALFVLVCVASVFLLNALYEPLPIAKSLFIALSTGIYLGLVGMTVANITRNTLAGIGAGIAYWFFEAGFNGQFTAPFYLLIVSHQIPPRAGEVWLNPAIWLPVKTGTLVLAALLFLVNGWLLDKGPKRRRALAAILIGYPLVFVLGWWLIPIFVG